MSVHELVSNLCISAYKLVDNTENVPKIQAEKNVEKLKRRAFEILLKEKYKTENVNSLNEFSNDISTQINIYLIEKLLRQEWQFVEKFQKFLRQIDIKKHESILRLLISLEDQNLFDIPYQDDSSSSSQHGHKNYPIIQFGSLEPLLPTSTSDLSSNYYRYYQTPYVDLKLLQFERLKKLDHKDCFNKKSPWFTSVAQLKPQLEAAIESPNFVISQDPIWNALEQIDLVEDLNSRRNDLVSLFTNNNLNLAQSILSHCEYDVTDEETFFTHATNLLHGVSSDSFLWSEKKQKFYKKINLCVNGILPQTLNKYCNILIELGSIFKRLYLLSISYVRIKEYGSLFTDLCIKLPEFFNFYRTLLLSQNISSIIQLHDFATKVEPLIHSVGKCFLIEIKNKNMTKRIIIKKGIELIMVIYKQFKKMATNEYHYVIHYFLHQAYQIYLRRFIKPWIFEGILNDPYNEFFITQNNSFINCRNRNYWSKCFKINTQMKLPPFLANCSDAILFCGKSISFLKLYNCSLPILTASSEMNIPLCLSETDLEYLEFDCGNYYEQVLMKIGRIISLQDIYALEDKRANELQIRAVNERENTVLAMQRELQMNRHKAFLAKQKLFKIYQEELKKNELVKQLISSKKIRQEIIELDNAKELEKNRTRMINEEKEELHRYYSHLTKQTTEKHQLIETKTKMLQKILSKDTLTLPLRNINTPAITNETLVANHYELLVNQNNNTTYDNKTTPINNNMVEETGGNGDGIDSEGNKIENLKKFLTNLVEKSITIVEETTPETCSTITEKTDSIIKPNPYLPDDLDIKPSFINFNPIYDFSPKIPSCDSYSGTTTSHNEVSESSFINDVSPKPTSITKSRRHNEESESSFITQTYYTWKIPNWNQPPPLKTESPPKPKLLISNFEETLNPNWINYEIENYKNFDLVAQQSLIVPLNTQTKLLGTYLMQSFLIDHDIVAHFRTLANYFFFFNSEYKFSLTSQLFQLLYTCANPKKVFTIELLNDLMEFALNTKSQRKEFTKRISLQLMHVPVIFDLKSAELLNCLALTYHVQWPLNIIISEKIIGKYNKIFQYLLKLRRVQWTLNQIFNILKLTPKQISSNEKRQNLLKRSHHYKSIHLMRHVINTWLASMLCHVTEVVLHSSWFQFEKNLSNAKTIDDLYHTHKKFINDAVFSCSLNEQSSYYIAYVDKAFEFVFQFYELFRNKNFDGNDFTHPNFFKLRICFDNFKEVAKFIIKLCETQVKKGYQPHLEQFLSVVNFNYYFS